VAVGDKLYQYFSASLTQSAAQTACQSLASGAHLAYPTSSTEIAAVNTVHASGDKWIGVARTTSTSAFTFLDGSSVPSLPWARKQPAAGLNCVVEVSNSKTWATASCTTAKPYVCELTLSQCKFLRRTSNNCSFIYLSSSLPLWTPSPSLRYDPTYLNASTHRMNLRKCSLSNLLKFGLVTTWVIEARHPKPHVILSFFFLFCCFSRSL
jgi:hypothetical protein